LASDSAVSWTIEHHQHACTAGWNFEMKSCVASSFWFFSANSVSWVFSGTSTATFSSTRQQRLALRRGRAAWPGAPRPSV
jgi:hypothetical protein